MIKIKAFLKLLIKTLLLIIKVRKVKTIALLSLITLLLLVGANIENTYASNSITPSNYLFIERLDADGNPLSGVTFEIQPSPNTPRVTVQPLNAPRVRAISGYDIILGILIGIVLVLALVAVVYTYLVIRECDEDCIDEDSNDEDSNDGVNNNIPMQVMSSITLNNMLNK